MRLNDIIADNYYAAHYLGELYPTIIKANKDGGFSNSTGIAKRLSQDYYALYTNNSFACKNDIRLATLEEIHWLNCCIELGHAISFEEAMETYIDSTIKYQQDSEYNNILIKLLINE